MAHCEDYIELISAAVDGALSPAQQEKLNAHLISCPDCQKLYDDLTAIHAALADLPTMEVPAELKGRILDAVAAEAESAKVVPFVPKKSSRHWQRWLASAAVLAIVLMGTWSWKPWETMDSQSAAPATEAVPDAGFNKQSVTGSTAGSDVVSVQGVDSTAADEGGLSAATVPEPAAVQPSGAPQLATVPLETAPMEKSADAPVEKSAARSAKVSTSTGGEVGYGYTPAAVTPAEAPISQAAETIAPNVTVTETIPGDQSATAEFVDISALQAPAETSDSQYVPRLFAAAIPTPAEEAIPEQDAISQMDAVNALVYRFYDGQVEHVEVTEEEPGRYTVGISPDAQGIGGASGVIVYVSEDEEVYLFDAKNDLSEEWFGVSVNKWTGEILGLDGTIPPPTPAEESPLPSPQP